MCGSHRERVPHDQLESRASAYGYMAARMTRGSVDTLTELHSLRRWVVSKLGMPGGDLVEPVAERQRQPVSDYEPPRIVFVGNVRDLTTGSAASGNQDANSQYYW